MDVTSVFSRSVDAGEGPCLRFAPSATSSWLRSRQPDRHGAGLPLPLGVRRALASVAQATRPVDDDSASVGFGTSALRRSAVSETGQPRRTPRPSARQVVAFAVVVALAAAGCGRGGDNASPAPTARSSASTSSAAAGTSMPGTTSTTAGEVSPTSNAESPTSTGGPTTDHDRQAIIDAYVGYWRARFTANSGTPNPTDPALAEFATGNQLEAVVKETQANLDQGHAFRAAPNPANFRKVTLVSIDGDRAQVQECFVDDDQVIDRATGNLVDAAVTTQSVAGTLRFVNGRWKVSGTRLVQEWEGVAGCARAS